MKRIVLLDLPAFEAYGDELLVEAADRADKDMESIFSTDECLRLVSQLAWGMPKEGERPSPKRWSPRELSLGEVSLVCDYLGNPDAALDSTREAIRDAYEEAWLVALKPSVDDLRYALEMARNELEGQLLFDDEIWREFLEKENLSEADLIYDLLKRTKFASRRPFPDLISEMSEAPLVKKARQLARDGKLWNIAWDEYWDPKEALEGIDLDLDGLLSKLIKQFAEELSEVRERHVTKPSFEPQWERILRNERRMEEVRSEMKDFAKQILQSR